MKKYILGVLLFATTLTSCEDFLTRDPMDQVTDTEALWNNEANFRSSMWAFYDVYFGDWKNSWTRTDWYSDTNVADWNDDNAQISPTHFTKVAPDGDDHIWYDSYYYIRRFNRLINRAENSSLPDEAKNHWAGVARFFRGLQYALLVQDYGDVPYIDIVVENTDEATLYKPRDPRTTVMDNVLTDLQFACEHIRTSDGVAGLHVNKAVALAYTSRVMLFEGTWQKYREGNSEAAKKYLKAAKDAAEELMGMGYSLCNNFKDLTTSVSLAGNPEIIIYCEYTSGVLTHSLMSFQSTENEGDSPSRSFVESYLSANGLPIHQAENTMYKGDKWFYEEFADRDPRLTDNIKEDGLQLNGIITPYAATGYFTDLFVNPSLLGTSEGSSSTVITDCPVMQYNEVLMNYIEAAAELNSLGAYTLTQTDFDKTINVIRQRPSTSMPTLTYSNGALSVNGVTINDPDRDLGYAEVSGDYAVDPVIWEIRRERRVELPYHGIRFDDLRRWSKLHYADMKLNKKLNLGAWLDKDEYIAWYNAENGTDFDVKVLDGVHLDRAGNVGYIVPAIEESLLRTYAEKDYLYPLPKDEITLYEAQAKATGDASIVLTQNPGW